MVCCAIAVVMLAAAADGRADVRVVGQGQLNDARGIGIDGDGNVYVAHRDAVLKFDSDGALIRSFGSQGTADGQFDVPMDVAVDGAGNIYAVDYGGQFAGSTTSRLTRFSPSGAVDWVVTVPFQSTWALTVTPAGKLWAAEANPRLVRRYATTDGAAQESFSWGNIAGGPMDLAASGDGNLVVSGTNGVIEEVTEAGTLARSLPSPGSNVVIGTDAAQNVYTAASDGAQLRKLARTGEQLASLPVEQVIRDIEVAPGGVVWALQGLRFAGGSCCELRLLRIDPRVPTAAVSTTTPMALTGQDVTFDASASTASLSSITRFEWDRDGDGVYESDTGSSPSLTTTYDTIGTRTVGVRVTAAGGRTATATTPVEIRLAPPAGPRGVSIEAGAQFTNDPNVSLNVRWPAFATQMHVSNDGGFANAQTFPVGAIVPWQLDSSGPERLPKTIYARFEGGQSGPETYQDDIILDQTPPEIDSVTGTAPPTESGVRKSAVRKPTYRLRIRASDKVSGVSRMQLTTDRKRPGAKIKFKSKPSFKTSGRRIYVRVEDFAGNLSGWRRVRLVSHS